MGEPAEKIVIGQDDLADARVDEALSRQLTFGMATAPAKVEDRGTAFFYRPYVALAVAGALGGLVGWAVIEPFLNDGIGFEGRVDEVELHRSIGANGAQIGTVTISGVQVWIVSDKLRVDHRGEAGGATELAEGQWVEVSGGTFDLSGADSVVATRIRVLREDAPPGDHVDLRAVQRQDTLVGFFVFVVIAAFVGLFIGAADGLLSRALRRAAVCGVIGLGMGVGAGLAATLLGVVIYGAGHTFVLGMDHSSDGAFTGAQLVVQMMVRGLAWACAGAAMGLGQGVALRSTKLLVNGLLGGVVGSLIGGLLFDPIDLLIGSGMDGDAKLSRCIGFVVIGLVTGLMIGIVELVAREAWIKMLTGPLAGKEFVLYKNPTTIGSSPKCDVYLFKDPEVEPNHALIHTVGDSYELEDKKGSAGSFVNGRKVNRVRLASGDQVRIGKTVFSLSVKEG